jgi:hypothetical protein
MAAASPGMRSTSAAVMASTASIRRPGLCEELSLSPRGAVDRRSPPCHPCRPLHPPCATTTPEHQRVSVDTTCACAPDDIRVARATGATASPVGASVSQMPDHTLIVHRASDGRLRGTAARASSWTLQQAHHRGAGSTLANRQPDAGQAGPRCGLSRSYDDCAASRTACSAAARASSISAYVVRCATRPPRVRITWA